MSDNGTLTHQLRASQLATFARHNTIWTLAIVFCASLCHSGLASDIHFSYGPLDYDGAHSVTQLRCVDTLDNIRALTALSGAALESYSYSPFGTRTIRDAKGNEIPSSAYGVTLGFGSRPPVKHLKVLDFQHRLFNPPTGAFLSSDPLHYVDTHNDRQYAMHNPIDLTDYHGLMSQGGQTTAQGAGTGAPVIPPTGNPTGNGEKPNGPNICVNGGAPANNLPWIMQNVQLQSPGEYEKRLREKLDELIKQHGEDIITAHESGALVPWARPPEYVIWLLNGDRPAFQAAISTQSQADLAKALINGRKPKPYEPGGWAFNALGPNGAAYELIAVFAGVTAAPRVFRGSTAPTQTQMPTALIPRSPRIRPATAAHTPSNAAHDPIFHGPKPSLTIANAAGGSQRRAPFRLVEPRQSREGNLLHLRERTSDTLGHRFGDGVLEFRAGKLMLIDRTANDPAFAATYELRGFSSTSQLVRWRTYFTAELIELGQSRGPVAVQLFVVGPSRMNSQNIERILSHTLDVVHVSQVQRHGVNTTAFALGLPLTHYHGFHLVD